MQRGMPKQIVIEQPVNTLHTPPEGAERGARVHSVHRDAQSTQRCTEIHSVHSLPRDAVTAPQTYGVQSHAQWTLGRDRGHQGDAKDNDV